LGPIPEVCQLQHHKAAVLPSDNLETTKQDPKTAPSVSGEQGVSGEAALYPLHCRAPLQLAPADHAPAHRVDQRFGYHVVHQLAVVDALKE